MIQVIARLMQKMSRSLLFYAACAVFLTTFAVVVSLLGTAPRPHDSQAFVGGGHVALGTGMHGTLSRDHGWGDAALKTVRGYAAAWSPIAVANACGMGASSCFKCHNSGRGPAISESPWHVDHEPVNGDCVGCHHGSPYLLKKSLAHADLIADPRTAPTKSCASAGCHQGENINKLVATYRKAGTQLKK